jgi:hypothetical protein
VIRPSLALPRGALRPEERKRPVRAKWILDRRLGWKKKVAAACRRVDQGGFNKRIRRSNVSGLAVVTGSSRSLCVVHEEDDRVERTRSERGEVGPPFSLAEPFRLSFELVVGMSSLYAMTTYIDHRIV